MLIFIFGDFRVTVFVGIFCGGKGFGGMGKKYGPLMTRRLTWATISSHNVNFSIYYIKFDYIIHNSLLIIY